MGRFVIRKYCIFQHIVSSVRLFVIRKTGMEGWKGCPGYGYDGYLSVDMFSGATETTKNLQLMLAGVAEYERMDMIWRTDIGYKAGDDWILNYVDDNFQGKWLFVNAM